MKYAGGAGWLDNNKADLANRYNINPADIIPENYLTKSTHKSQNHGATPTDRLGVLQ